MGVLGMARRERGASAPGKSGKEKDAWARGHVNPKEKGEATSDAKSEMDEAIGVTRSCSMFEDRKALANVPRAVYRANAMRAFFEQMISLILASPACAENCPTFPLPSLESQKPAQSCSCL